LKRKKIDSKEDNEKADNRTRYHFSRLSLIFF